MVRASPIDGRGLFFTDSAGTVVFRLGRRMVSSAVLAALTRDAEADSTAAYVDTITVYSDVHLVLWTTDVSDNGMTSQDTITVGPVAGVTSQPTAQPGPGILILVAAGMALLGAMLLWVTITTIFGSLSVNGMKGDGKLTALGGLVLGVIALIALVTKTRNRAPGVLAVVIGGAIFVVGLIDVLDVSHRIAGVQATAGVADASVGVGLWLTCLAGLVGLAGGIALVAPKLIKS